MTRTFIDSSVLIAAAIASKELHEEAMAILDDPNRSFVSSDFVKLETLPKAVFHRNEDEAEFYRMFFDAAEFVGVSPKVVDMAYEEACAHNINARDALHVAAAAIGGADELVTGEKPEKPICQTQRVKVVSLRSPDAKNKSS